MQEYNQKFSVERLKQDIKMNGLSEHVVKAIDGKGQKGFVIDHPGRYSIKPFADSGYITKVLKGTEFAVYFNVPKEPSC